MQLRATIVIVLAACSRPPPAASPPSATTSSVVSLPGAPSVQPRDDKSKCSQVLYVFKVLYAGSAGPLSPFHSADSAAKADYELAAASTDDQRAAALHFLDCAKRYRAVPDADASWSTAQENAQVCYYDAIYAFANASRFAAEGKALLESAATEDPRLASYIYGQLARPPTECRR